MPMFSSEVTKLDHGRSCRRWLPDSMTVKSGEPHYSVYTSRYGKVYSRRQGNERNQDWYRNALLH